MALMVISFPGTLIVELKSLIISLPKTGTGAHRYVLMKNNIWASGLFYTGNKIWRIKKHEILRFSLRQLTFLLHNCRFYAVNLKLECTEQIVSAWE